MSTTETSVFTPELVAAMQIAAHRAAAGDRDPEAMKQASESMDRIREEIRSEHGILDIGVHAIREARTS